MTLCPDHAPVARNLARHVHTGDADVDAWEAMIGRCCPQCAALQPTDPKEL